MKKEANISLIFSQLSKESQRHLINMAYMAKVAESGKAKELAKEKQSA